MDENARNEARARGSEAYTSALVDFPVPEAFSSQAPEERDAKTKAGRHLGRTTSLGDAPPCSGETPQSLWVCLGTCQDGCVAVDENLLLFSSLGHPAIGKSSECGENHRR